MTIRSNHSVHNLGMLVLVAVLLAALTGCGATTPEPQVVVVTSTYTATPQVVVVTATHTPTSPPTATPLPTDTPPPTATPLPTDTPLPPPTDPPPPEASVTYVAYEHPSGTFGLEVPVDAELNEAKDNLIYFFRDSVFMIIFTQLDAVLDAADLEEMIPTIVDSALVGEGLIDTYEALETIQGDEGAGDPVLAAGRFDMTSELFGDGEGGIILSEYGQTLYIQVLVTPNYEAVEEVWEATFDTMWAVPRQVQMPTLTSPPPTAAPTTAPPTPKPTARPQPTNTSPPPPAAKGCYLFQNFLDAEVTITFTAQDWQWNDTLAVGAGQEQEYCLDPGRYTYSMDAPPPWNSLSGELTVAAGDAFLWPIQGR